MNVRVVSILISVFTVVLLSSSFVFAQGNIIEPTGIQKLVFKINENIVNPAIVTLFAVAFVLFVWGIVEYLRKANDATAREVGRRHMLWALVGFVIMLGIYGIINLLITTFNIKGPVINQREQKFNPPNLPNVEIK